MWRRHVLTELVMRGVCVCKASLEKQLTLCAVCGPIAQMQLQHRPSEQLTLRSGLTGRRPRPTVSYSRVMGAFTTLSQHFWRQQQYEMVWGCRTLSI